MRDEDSPFGGHHINCYLLAPRRHKLDGYWHVISHSLYYVQPLALRPLIIVLARDTSSIVPINDLAVKNRRLQATLVLLSYEIKNRSAIVNLR